MKIRDTYLKLKCRQILTSKGLPTIETDLKTTIGTFRSSCPAGQSTGTNEAKTIIDHGSTYLGKSVNKARFNIKKIIRPRLTNIYDLDIHDQKGIDDFLVALDGTENLERLGANAVLPVSISFCRAGAESLNYELWEFLAEFSNSTARMPFPCFNIINGGLHSGNELKIQEIMVCFKDDTFEKNLEHAVVLYNHLKNVIRDKYGSSAINVGDEGGFAPPIKTLEEGLDLILEAHKRFETERKELMKSEKDAGSIKENGDVKDLKKESESAKDVDENLTNELNWGIVIDAAASSYFKGNHYHLERKMTKSEYIEYLKQIVKKYPEIFMIEDPFAEDDYESWACFRKYFGNYPGNDSGNNPKNDQSIERNSENCKNDFKNDILIMGDDLTVTNSKIIQKVASQNLCNAVLIKPNQNGTVTGTLLAIKEAKKSGMPICVSHRSSETEDTFVSDLAVGVGAEYVKFGAPCRGERVAKYNQLLRIEKKMMKKNKKN